MQCNMGLKFGVIWARQYLLKASKAKLEVSTATKAKLARACPIYRPTLYQSVFLQRVQSFTAQGEASENVPCFQTYRGGKA